MYLRLIKPVIDKFVSLIILILCSPMMLLVMVALLLANGGRVWFIQERPGKDGQTFKLIKFRTMSDARSPSGELLPDDQRLTVTGRFIRKTSIDELPQLLNVLLGEMSLVGPRPLLMQYLPLYNERQSKRHMVRPGITGWAQVNGRNTISWAQKFDYDVWYVENISFSLDVRILFLTIIRVLGAEGVSAKDYPTMKNFTGNN